MLLRVFQHWSLYNPLQGQSAPVSLCEKRKDYTFWRQFNEKPSDPKQLVCLLFETWLLKLGFALTTQTHLLWLCLCLPTADATRLCMQCAMAPRQYALVPLHCALIPVPCAMVPMQCALVPMQCRGAYLMLVHLTVANTFHCRVMQPVWAAFSRDALTAKLGQLQSLSWPV